jgi:hypothetical protein
MLLLQFSARMNAWATYVFGFWLMGEVTINNVEIETKDGTTILKDQGVLVKRCRFLEESGCASVCVNSCKIPTQNFFLQDMGIPLTMTPDYDTFECQFSFGVSPDAMGEEEVKNTPCLMRCPTAGAMRSWHNNNKNGNDKNIETSPTSVGSSSASLFSSPNNNDLTDSSIVSSSTTTSKCHLMEGVEE